MRLNKAVTGINKDLLRKQDVIKKLKAHIDKIEQKQKEARVRITGVEEEINKNLPKKISKIAKNKLGLKLKEECTGSLQSREEKRQKNKRHRNPVQQKIYS